MRKLNYVFMSCALLFFVCAGQARADLLDSWLEVFDQLADGFAVDGYDHWQVYQGLSNNAIAQSTITPTGSGKSLQLVGTNPTTDVQRSFSYGGLTPTWIRFRARPPQAVLTPLIPATGILAITFDPSGNLQASSGRTWVNTGKSFNFNQWYDVAIKLDFTAHTYAIYCTSTQNPSVEFVPLKSGLKFIDPTVNSLSNLKFLGAYAQGSSADTYLDDIFVNYFYELMVVTPAQKLMLGQASGPITVQLQSYSSSPQAQTAKFDMALELKSTSPKGQFSARREPWTPIQQIIIPREAQVATVYYKDLQEGKPLITFKEFPEQGLESAKQVLEIVSKVSFFDIQADSTQIAGQPFKVKIIAKDKDGNLNEAYAGTVKLNAQYDSPQSGAGKISPEEVTGFARGVAEAVLVYPDCGYIKITAADSENPSQEGSSPQLYFVPASFRLKAEPKQVVARLFNLEVSALNRDGAVTPNYTGNPRLYPLGTSATEIPQGAVFPSVIQGTDFKAGVAAMQVSYSLYGTIKFRAEDNIDISREGYSEAIKFIPAQVAVQIDPAPGSRGFFYIGEPVAVKVKVLDALNNPIMNYPGKIDLASTAGFILPSEYVFSPVDQGAHTFLGNSSHAGNFSVDVKAEDGVLKSTSADILVKNATLVVEDTVSPIGRGEVTIKLVDELGNVITSENQLPVVIRVFEDVENSSVFVPFYTVTLQDGRATIPILDTEAETVGIGASTSYKIQAKKGSITFGKGGRTGIGTLLWRELKKK